MPEKTFNVKKFVPLEFAANNYLVYNDKQALLIDCAGSNEEIFKFLDDNNLTLEKILITHPHFDHCLGLFEVKEKFPDVKIYLPKEDKELYSMIPAQCAMFGQRPAKMAEVDEFIDENSDIELFNGVKNAAGNGFSSGKIKIISTPGHSKGSLCYLIGENLFSGDTLFFEEIGRCDLPTGSFKEIEHSIKEKLFKLEDNIKVFSGHGDNTDIGHEKIYNAYFGKNARY